MKKLTLSLLFSISIFTYIHSSTNPIITNLGPIQLITPNGSNIFAAGNVNIYGNIKIGNSPTDTIILQAAGITYPSSNNNNLLIINSTGNILTANSGSPLSCGPLTASSLTTSGNLIAGNTTCGNLNAANNIGQNIMLGNNAGIINLVSSNIINPAAENYNLLTIDSNGNINTANASSSITVGDINSNSLTTTGNVSCDSVTTNTINISNSLNCGTLTAASNTGQSVILGNATGIINLVSSNIINPSSGNYNLLTIDSNGNVNTANPSTAITVGNLTTNNINSTGLINCNAINTNNISVTGPLNCGTLVAGGGTGQTITLGNNTGSINLKSSNIINPVSGNYNLLLIDGNGNINTSNPATQITIGDIISNSITSNSSVSCISLTTNTITTSGSLYCGSFTAAGNTGEKITLGNNTGTITLNSSNIINPSSGNYNLLTIDSNGNINTASASTQITIGDIISNSLTTTGSINCGPLTSSNISTNGSLNCGPLTAASGTGQSIILGNNTGSITLNSSNIMKPSSGSSPLYINSNGMITTTNSSAVYKKEIKKLQIENNYFDKINPVSFYYINDENMHLEYGLIAEELLEIPIIKNAVIFGHNGKPLSIDYKAISIMLIADYKNTKKELKRLQEQIESILGIIATEKFK
jgi:hypothetical protein